MTPERLTDIEADIALVGVRWCSCGGCRYMSDLCAALREAWQERDEARAEVAALNTKFTEVSAELVDTQETVRGALRVLEDVWEAMTVECQHGIGLHDAVDTLRKWVGGREACGLDGD